jgi:hypothetical protein
MRFLATAILLLPTLQDKPCDLAKTEIRDYCPSCKIWPASEHIDKGAHLPCRSKVERAEACIKYFWNCPTAHGVPRRHSKDCGASPGCCKEFPSLSLVAWTCDGCRAGARRKEDLRHSADGCTGPIRKVCSRSGKFPHGGDE